MPFRAKLLVLLTVASGATGLWWSVHLPSQDWSRFAVYLGAVLLSSGLKISLPRGDRKLAFHLPFILLAVVQLAPRQAVALAAIAALAECLIGVRRHFPLSQVLFNVGNVMTATAVACWLTIHGRAHGLTLAMCLALATLGYFLVNTLLVAAVLGWSHEEGAIALWRKDFVWYLPFYFVSGMLAMLVDMAGARMDWFSSLLLLPAVYSIYRSYKAQKRVLEDRQEHLDEAEALHLRTIEGLAMAIEAKDHNTHEHLLRVRAYATEIGRILGLDRDQMQALGTAAFLHDIGKLAVPEIILNKPGRLTPEEFEKMKIHPVVGAEILDRVRFPYPVVPIVRSHHEAWDGSGYPDGLAGEEIPIGARILSVVDCFDALSCDRPYRRGTSAEEAMAFVQAGSGTKFDPRVVAILAANYLQLMAIAAETRPILQPLDTDITVRRGEAPGAGFHEESEASTADAASAWPPPAAAGHAPTDALALIAASGKESHGLFEMAQSLGSSLSPSETILVLSSRLRRLIPFDCSAVYLAGGGALTLRQADGPASVCLTSRLIAMGEGLSGFVAACGEPVVNGNPHVESNYVKAAEMTLESALSIPLRSPSGEVFGVLTLYARRANAFSREHLRLLLAVESKFALSLENALRFRQAEHDALVDPLTELPGLRQYRAALDAELNRARRGGDVVTVAVCDVNRFQQITEQKGRGFGDQLLRKLAASFRESCRSYDTVARVGANKFLFLFPATEGARGETFEGMIHAAVARVSRDAALDVELTASVGVASFPGDATTAEDLLAAADRSMHVEKRRYYATSATTSSGSPRLIAVA